MKKLLMFFRNLDAYDLSLMRRLMNCARLAALCMSISLTLFIFPGFSEKAGDCVQQSIRFVQTGFTKAEASIRSFASNAKAKKKAKEADASLAEKEPETLTVSPEKGQAEDLNMETNLAKDTGFVYDAILGTSLGPMTYYGQGDSRWAEYLYGGADPMKSYGCGPTAVAMLVNSLSPQQVDVTPVDIAEWAAANGCYAPQSGSYHSLIPKALSAYGLKVTPVKDRSAANAASLLNSGHVLVALMGRGSLTQNGHFIIITQLLEDGVVSIADPNSFENSTRSWDLELLMNELKKVYDSGAPLWAVGV